MLRLNSELPRIAMLSTHGYVAGKPPLGMVDTGGQVVYVLELSKKMAQLGYEVDIWTRRFEDQCEIEPVADRVRIMRVACAGPRFIPKEYLCDALPEWCERAADLTSRHGLAYEFVNTHYWDAGMAGRRLCAVLNVPHVHTPHSIGLWKKRQMEHDYPEDAHKFEQQYNFAKRIASERLIYASADQVIATSPQQLDLLVEDYEVPKEKCCVIPPGYDDSRFFPVGAATRNAIRHRLGFDGHVVMAVGRLARNKGYDLLVHGFSVVAQRDPHARLCLAVGGSNPTPLERRLRAELEELISRLGLADKVRLGSYIPDEDLADYYRAADVFVLSSRYEPFGMTAIEAMACGTPAVVTIHGGLFRALTFGRHALHADPFDKEDLGITIWKVLRDRDLRERLGRMGALKSRSLFTWTGVAQQLVALAGGRPTEALAFAEARWDNPWNDPD